MQVKTSKILTFSIIGVILSTTNIYANRAIIVKNINMNTNQCWLKFIARDPKKSDSCNNIPEKNNEEIICIYKGDKETLFNEALLVCPQNKPVRCNKDHFMVKDASDHFLPPALRFEIKKNPNGTKNLCTFTNEDRFKMPTETTKK